MCLARRIQMQLYPNQKIFSNFFFYFWILHKIWNSFKEKMTSEVICFWYYRLQKAGLLKCWRSLVSQHIWTVKMLKYPKHCLNLHGSIFVKFFYHSERKWAVKDPFKQCLKPWDCLLTYWLPMTSTLSQ